MENISRGPAVESLIEAIKDKAKHYPIIKTILIRGSLSRRNWDSSYSDIDLTLIINQKHTISDIIKIKDMFNRLSKKIPISITFFDKTQLIKDAKKGIHFHGRKAAVYSKEIAESVLLYGEDVRGLFNKCNKYSNLDMYRQSCDLIANFHKDIFLKHKKGINFSVILAKRCLNSKRLFPSETEEIIGLFKKKISFKHGNNLERIRNLRKKKSLTVRDLEDIYKMLLFCRGFLFKQVNKSELQNLIQRKE